MGGFRRVAVVYQQKRGQASLCRCIEPQLCSMPEPVTPVQAKPCFKKSIELEPSNGKARLRLAKAEEVLLGWGSCPAIDRSA